MRLFAFTFFTALTIAGSLPAADAPAGEGFKGYRNVRLRNIFDPSRQRDPTEGAPAPKPVSTGPARSPFIALTGTMVRPEKALGFFTGSATDHNRVIAAGETIAGYKVRAITITGAELEHEGKALTLPVGRQIPLEGSNAGTAQPFAPDTSAVAPVVSSTEPSSTTSSAPSGPAADIIQRMKDRRRKETSK